MKLTSLFRVATCLAAGCRRNTCAVLLLLAASSTPVFADNPSQPGSLRFAVYSDSAAELFWERSTDDGYVGGYEIVRNGVVLDTRDALSYFDNTQVAGTRYTYQVTAIDLDGNRSTTASVTLTAGVQPAEGSGTSRLDQPADLRASVYDTRSFELFWTRAPEAVSYEVKRNGTLIRTTDGASAYITGVSGNSVLDVVAIDAAGNRSAPASVAVNLAGDPGTPGGSEGPPAPSTLRVDVYSPNSFELFWARVPGQVLNYEILRGTEVVGTTDGTSFYEPNGSGNADYAVIAIDQNGQRSNAATISVSLSGGGGNGNGNGGGGSTLAAPTGLRAERYAGTSGELFWERVNGANLTYEIRQGDQVVGTTDGASFYTQALSPGQAADFAVIAIGGDGTRSSAATVTIPGGGSVAGPASGPTAPTGIRGTLYSANVGEVFWDRMDSQRLTYDVLINGAVVATTDGASYFITGANDLSGTTVAVVAIDANGQRSNGTTVTLGGDANTGDPSAADQRAIEQLSAAFDSLFLDEVEELEAVVFNIRERINAGEFSLIEFGTKVGSLETTSRTYACPFGGTIKQYTRIVTLMKREYFDIADCRGENYIVSGDRFNFDIGGRRTIPFAFSLSFSGADVALLNIQERRYFTADVASRNTPTEELFTNASSSNVSNGQLSVDQTVRKAVSSLRLRNEYPSDVRNSQMPIETTIRYQNSNGMSDLLSIEITDALLSSSNTDETLIEQGSLRVSFVEGDYTLDAVPDSPAEFTYTSPSGETGTLTWSAVGFEPIINLPEPFGTRLQVTF